MTLPVMGQGTVFQVVPLGLPFGKLSALNASTLRSSSPVGFCLQTGFESSGHSSMIVAMMVLPLLVISTHDPAAGLGVEVAAAVAGNGGEVGVLGHAAVGDVHDGVRLAALRAQVAASRLVHAELALGRALPEVVVRELAVAAGGRLQGAAACRHRAAGGVRTARAGRAAGARRAARASDASTAAGRSAGRAAAVAARAGHGAGAAGRHDAARPRAAAARRSAGRVGAASARAASAGAGRITAARRAARSSAAAAGRHRVRQMHAFLQVDGARQARVAIAAGVAGTELFAGTSFATLRVAALVAAYCCTRPTRLPKATWQKGSPRNFGDVHKSA